MANHKRQKTNKKKTEKSSSNYSRANFSRRMGAYFFDLISVSILLLIATIFAVALIMIANKIGLIDITAYKSISDYLAHNLIFAGYLTAITLIFYSYYWSKVGQTMGMKIFHLRIQNINGTNISLTQALIRMATSAFGLGNFFSLMSPYNSFQDSWAECEVVMVLKSN